MVAISDTVRALSGKKAKRKSTAQIFRGKVWLSYVLHSQNLTLSEFSNRYLEGREAGAASLVYKWANGETVPSSKSANRIGQYIPSAKTLFELPLWDLLEDKPISKSTIKKLIKPYWTNTKPASLGFWNFPQDEFSRSHYPHYHLIKTNSKALLERGDVYGFTAITALVRDAEAQGLPDDHWMLTADLYRAIPAIAKLPWINPHLYLLKECVENIRRRFMTSYFMFSVDWDVIVKQIGDPSYETIRFKRPRDPKTLRFIEPEDPIKLNNI